MNDKPVPRYGIDPYLEWVEKEGIPIADDYALDLLTVETAHWPRYGIKGAACHLKGRGDFSSMFLYDIPPGAASSPQRHLYEEVIYVLEGSGSTQLEYADGSKRAFEWGERSLFAIPLNVKHRHYNASGQRRALMVSTTDLPLVMNTFHNERLVFETDLAFGERTGRDDYYTGGGDLHMIRPGNHLYETNFVPDLADLELPQWDERGAGSSTLVFILADGLMHAHISEMPVGTYKKAHRHMGGFHVLCVSGEGYSLFWFEGDADYKRVDWRHGVVLPPADLQFHQHFNTAATPARYMATAVGSRRYPLTAARRRMAGATKSGAKASMSTSLKKGGDQIEYEDQDPRIHPMWLAELRKNGVKSKMNDIFPADTGSGVSG